MVSFCAYDNTNMGIHNMVILPDTPHLVGQKCVNDVKNELLRTRSDMVRDSGLNTRLLVLCRLLNISY